MLMKQQGTIVPIVGSCWWLDMLPRMLKSYSDQVHRTICMRLVDIKDNSLLQTVYKAKKRVDTRRPRAHVGDYVHFTRDKGLFVNVYELNWSTKFSGY
ncbi:hypothetical protein PR048_026764 [Dryococelus australis]|uniref:Uncharacterized protein n=1 Tax=Dryococelus australis TaxID=614101 RepID=A0ABQ9GM92_9NEOP|nr:hypothetical protein PR048_026764 [Dryococelus australis]